jgi:small subunit ribosomal protein S19
MSRSNWKGPYVQKALLEKSIKLKNNKKKKIKTWSRQSTILPVLVGLQINVHNGKKFIKLKIVEDMLGHKLGEFVVTRAKFFYKKTKKK